MAGAIASSTVHLRNVTEETVGVPYPLVSLTFDNLTTSIDRVVARPVSNASTNAFDSDSSLAAAAFANNAGNLQITLGAGSVAADYSATAGAYGHEVHVDFGSEYTDGWYRVAAVAGADDAVVLTLALPYTADPSSATVSQSFAGDLTSGQGSASGRHTGNLSIDKLDEGDFSAGIKVFLYLETALDLDNEFKLYVMEADGAVLPSPLLVDDTFSFRSALGMTITDADDNAASTDSYHRHYPLRMTTRSTFTETGFTILKGQLSGGQGSEVTYENHEVHLFQATDGIADWLAVDSPDASGAFEVYAKAGSTAITDTESLDTHIELVAIDPLGRYVKNTYYVALMGLNEHQVTLNPSATTTHEGHAAFDDISGPIPVLKVQLTTTPTGSVGTYSIVGNSNFVIGGSYTSNFSDNGSGKVRVTHTAASDTSGWGDYVNVGDFVNLGADYGDALVTAIVDADSFDTDADYLDDEVADNTSVAVTMTNSGACHVMLADDAAVSNTSAYTLSSAESGQLVYTENGYTFNVLDLAEFGDLTVWKFDALKSSDFTFTLVPDADNGYSTGEGLLAAEAEATHTLRATWSASKGLGDVDAFSVAVSYDEAFVQPANTDLGLGNGDVILQAASSDTVDASAGATGIDVQLVEHDTNTFAGFFDAAAGSTKYMQMSFTVTMANAASSAASPIGSEAMADVLRVYQNLVAASVQTVFRIDYSDTGGDYQTGTKLIDHLASGGGFTDYTHTTITSVDIDGSSYLAIDDTNDDIELVAAAISAPTTVTVDDATFADGLTQGTANELSVEELNVHLYDVPEASYDTGSTAVRLVPLDGDDNIDTSEWITYDVTVSGGHSLITSGVSRQARSTNIAYGGVGDGNGYLVCALADTTGFSVGDTIVLQDGGGYASSSVGNYTVDAVVENVSVSMQASSAIGDGEPTTGVLQILDGSVPRAPYTVTVGSSVGGNDNAGLFQWVFYDNGSSSSLKLRLLDTDTATYSGEVFNFTLTRAAYTPSTDADGAVGSSGELWGATTTNLAVTFTNPEWDLGTRTSTILANFGTGTDPSDSNYDYAHANDAQTLLLAHEINVTGVSFGLDPTKIVVAAVADFDTDTVNTAATIDFDTVVAAPTGVNMQVSKDGGSSWSETSGNNYTTTAGDEYESGDMLRLVLDLANVSDGSKYLIMLLTTADATLTDGRVDDRFMRRAEVRYSGGLESFTLSADTAHSWPGSASYTLSNIVAYNSSGVALSSSVGSHAYDIRIDAAVVAAGSSAPSATASASTWQWPVLAEQTNQSATEVNETHLRMLPDNVPVVTGNTLPSDGATSHKDLYNTSSGLNYASSNTNQMRVYYRVGLRLYNTSGVAASDDDFVYAVVAGSSRTTDASSRVNYLGMLYHRFAISVDDGIHVVSAGMVHRAWTNTSSRVLRVYSFTNVVARYKMVEDDDVISGSEP